MSARSNWLIYQINKNGMCGEHWMVNDSDGKCPVCKEEQGKKELHVFTNGVEWVIAYDELDAQKVWEETVGEKYDVEELEEFYQESDDKFIPMYLEDEENLKYPVSAVIERAGEFSALYKAPNKDWIECLGRCYFGSTEY